MVFLRILFILSLFSSTVLLAEDSIEDLLHQYKEESKLSNITKRESAGILELFTRDELDKMQAHTLKDILRIIPGLVLSKNNLGITSLKPLANKTLSDASVRLYINDHEMTSASYGSASLMWSDMPLEFVDHIEVYKATSSIEFGNEVAALVIRIYTKKAQREEGSKARLMVSDAGGYDANLYTAHVLENGLSYFAYGNRRNLVQDKYTHEYNNKRYDINDNTDGHLLYANLSYQGYCLDIGSYVKVTDAYLGAGHFSTPSGDGIESRHYYFHLSKEFENGLKFQLGYDDSKNKGVYRDENYIPVSDGNSPGTTLTNPNIPPSIWAVQSFYVNLHDTITSVILEKEFKSTKNRLLVGAFYKRKVFSDGLGAYSNIVYAPVLGYGNYEVHADSINNSLNLYSMYFEENYYYDKDTQFVLSMKGDFYRFSDTIRSQNKLIARAGFIKNIHNLQVKFFASSLYTPATMIELYREDDALLRKANPHLEYPSQRIYTASVRYKKDAHAIEAHFLTSKVKDAIHYDFINGYTNLDETKKYKALELSYKYKFNGKNKLYCDYVYGKGDDAQNSSPKHMLIAKLFNTYKHFDFYNALTYLGTYTEEGRSVGASYDYTAAIKYHFNDDISLGFLGENIFKSGYKEVYESLPYTIAITQQRFWVNFEVTF